MYKLKAEALKWEPIPGIPWRDMEDEEYKAVCAAYDTNFPDQPGSLRRWFDYVADKPAKLHEED
jgi:hypothetical protein